MAEQTLINSDILYSALFYKEDDDDPLYETYSSPHLIFASLSVPADYHRKSKISDDSYDALIYRNIDGSGNHSYGDGAAHSALATVAGHDYGDGYNSPAGSDRPGAREISNMIFAQNSDIPSTIKASNLLWMWGQFLDHDITLTPVGAESFNIAVPAGDPYFDPYSTGTAEIALHRSATMPGTGTDINNPREQINEITAFIDASNVYGSDEARATAMRDENGYLKLSENGYLPFNEYGMENANGNPFLSADELFLAGDIRANETVPLTAMHTLFAREHNRVVDILKTQYPDMSAEALYQHAKAYIEAEMQVISYNEFVPLLIGEQALAKYDGYDPAIDPQITNEFATAAYRLGHSMLSPTITRLQEDGSAAAEGDLALQNSFFNPSEVIAYGIDTLLRGQAATHSQAIDTLVIDDVRNFLFGPPGAGGMDLVSLNIQRGRDHGLQDFNSVREAYGLDSYDNFDEITSDPALADKLETLYGDINNIDLFVGGLAEDHAEGAVVGETFQAILAQQFHALRAGDKYWYQNRFDGEFLEDLENTTLSDVIRRNSDIDYLQQDIFIASERIGGTATGDTLNGTTGNDLIIGFQANDLLYGHEGDDTLYGGHDDDILYGGGGNDYLAGEDGMDILKGGDGDDRLLYDPMDQYWGGNGFDTLYIGEEHAGNHNYNDLNIHDGIEVLDFNNGKDDVLHLFIEDILSDMDGQELFVLGDDGQDTVIAHQFMDGHLNKGGEYTVEAGGVEYVLYSNGEYDLFVEAGLIALKTQEV